MSSKFKLTIPIILPRQQPSAKIPKHGMKQLLPSSGPLILGLQPPGKIPPQFKQPHGDKIATPGIKIPQHGVQLLIHGTIRLQQEHHLKAHGTLKHTQLLHILIHGIMKLVTPHQPLTIGITTLLHGKIQPQS